VLEVVASLLERADLDDPGVVDHTSIAPKSSSTLAMKRNTSSRSVTSHGALNTRRRAGRARGGHRQLVASRGRSRPAPALDERAREHQAEPRDHR